MFKIKKNLIVGSVFTPGDRTETWYKLQIQFLKKTTKNFKHFVFLNGKIDQSIFNESEIIGSSPNHALNIMNGTAQSSNHLIGLNSILSKFRNTNGDNYLFLDSDCFPVMNNWLPTLLNLMSKKNKSIAAPIRTDNLDLFPHPSALFVKRDALHKQWFDLSLGTVVNLMGTSINDVGGKLPLKECYPLLRSNYFNAHPIFGAIYGHMFYHHTCGTRPKGMLTRGIMEDTSSHYIDKHWEIEEVLFNKLKNESEVLIDKFLGKFNDLEELKLRLK